MANIVFLSLVFPPDGVSTAQIMGHLAQDLKDLGHSITIITTTPHYNHDSSAEAKQRLKPEWGRLLQKSDYYGIPVYHVLMPRKGSNVSVRILAWISFHILSTIVGVVKLKKTDIFIVPSPPLTIGVSAWLLGFIKQAPYIYNVQEVYPDYAIRVGALRNKFLISILYKLESFVYKKSGAVAVIAPHIAEELAKKGAFEDKLVVIPNFVDTNELTARSKDNPFSRQHDLTDKFVVTYAGNMGVGQDLERFIDTAGELRDHENIHFLMMGDGMQRDALFARYQEAKLSNFTFLPFQPYELIPDIYASSDLNLVPQSPDISSMAIPSKVYRIMACERAVLASTTQESDLANLIRESNGGFIAQAGSTDSLANTILDAYTNPDKLAQIGSSGRQHVLEHYSRSAVSSRYNALVTRLAG